MQESFLRDLQELPKTVRDRVWSETLDGRGYWVALGIRFVRLVWAVFRDLRGEDLSLRAMSLVYTTILSLVPLLAVSFSVLKGFGVHEELETMMMRALLPLGEQGVEIGIRIIEFVENVKVGVLGSVGLGLLLYTVISLMLKIERAFNRTWRVSQERAFSQRFSGYLSVVIVGPVLVFSSMGLTATLMSTELVTAITAIEPFGTVMGWGSKLLPFVLVVGAFTFIYVFMPNTSVHPVSAFAGSLIASTLWHLAGWIFASFVVSSAQYTAIYSAFAGLIVFMLWLYVSWLVLLIGASVAFYHQNPEMTAGSTGDLPPSPRMAERLSLALLAEIGSAFNVGDSRPTTAELADGLRIPRQTASNLLATLHDNGFVLPVESPERWIPALPLEKIALDRILAAIRAAGEVGRLSPRGAAVPDRIERLAVAVEAGGSDSIRGQTLKSLVEDAETVATAPIARLHDRDAATGE